MSIIKSRGTAHSNQVRELILSDAGVTLADIYTLPERALVDVVAQPADGVGQLLNVTTLEQRRLSGMSLHRRRERLRAIPRLNPQWER